MRILLVAVGTAVLTAGTPALAQQAAGSDVNSYLCTFAGKCGDTTADAAPTMAAPATKGFRLAASAPTVAAPPTKGFRLANGAPSASVAAPQTRSFRVVRTPAPAAVVAVTQSSRPMAPRRNMVPVARPVMSVGARADLMLTFEYNSDQMTPAALARAKTFAQALQMSELRAKRFLIEGHTDARGSRDLNIDLSRRRAQTVADFLVAQGVERNRVEVKGVGPDQPLPGRSAAAEANRRVEAVLLS